MQAFLVLLLDFTVFCNQHDEKLSYWFLEEIRFNPLNDRFTKI